MAYPDYMVNSMEKVVATRDARLKKEFRRMSLSERDEVLSRFHPDYKEGTKRPLRIGPNKGDLMPHEVADILEAHPMITPKDIDLSDISYDSDVLIIGSGGAGISAALQAMEQGIERDRLLLVTKLRLGDSNSKLSQGGIQAADAEDDSPPLHFLDVLGGGHFTNDPDLVEILVKEAPGVIKWHEELGVIYDKNADGTMVLDSGGGTCRRRMHSCKDYTGLEILRVLMDEFRSREIPYIEFASAIELLLDDEGAASGAVLYNMETGEYYVARAKATVLATGGYGRLHIQGFETTNHYGATMDGVVLAYHVGAELRDLDATQYHPTGAAYPEQIVGQLCTEKLRTYGAQPVNKEGEIFVHPLEPRDVESAAYIRECYERGKGIVTPTGMRGVWLDIPLIDIVYGEGTIDKRFAAMFRQYNRFGINIKNDPVLVFPTLHYQNGGVTLNARTESSVPGLYVAGEVSGGVHGKNRLMGNSQLELYVFGRRTGRFAAEYAKKRTVGQLSLGHLYRYEQWLSEAGIETERKSPILLPEYRGQRVLTHKLRLFE